MKRSAGKRRVTRSQLADRSQTTLLTPTTTIVVKGFQQKKGVDFNEIFAPVVKMTSIRMVLSIAASMNLEVEQLDVKM